MSDLVFEIGLEELPASFVHGALEALPDLAKAAFNSARLTHGAVRALGAPRRLTLYVEDLAAVQPDLSEEVLGPPERAAFEEDGTPKKAALGFAKKLGLDVSALTIEETEKGRYVAGLREEKGLPAREVLPRLLLGIAKKIPFPKSMRWGEGEHSFGRPVHWLVCLHGEDVIDVSLFGVRAGRESRGHRFLADEPCALQTAGDYLAVLRDAHVLADPEERVKLMMTDLEAAAIEAGGVLVDDPFLIGENGTMVEMPHVICGSFEEAFLALPDAVTIEVMRGHQRYFALRDKAGRLMPRYLAVVNTNLAPEIITQGNDRVLRARLADARFFVEEDRKVGLDAYAEQLGTVVFQTKLGSVRDRIPRLAAVGAAVAAEQDEGGDRLEEAARLAKADLVSLIVGEFPELQGIMGRWYAEESGVDDAVALAIEEHYRPRGAGDEVPGSITGARLAVAERVDLLVGCFGLGLIPSGSADPFALRRATLGIIRIALEGPIDVDLTAALRAGYAAYHGQGTALRDEATVLSDLDDFFRGRLRAYLSEQRPNDVVDACLGAWPGSSLRDLEARLRALDEFRKLPAYESLATAFKRAHNISKDAVAGAFDDALATEDAERALAACWKSLDGEITTAVKEAAYAPALKAVAEQLKEPIDRFFDEVLVICDDEAVRDNRLRLLRSIADRLSGIAHFHMLGGR